MINKIFLAITTLIIVFIQVYFFDMFDFKIPAVLVIFFLFYIRDDTESLDFTSYLIFGFYEFFNNSNLVGIYILVYILIGEFLKFLSKNYGFNLVFQTKILSSVILFHLMSNSFLSSSFWISCVMMLLVIVWVYLKKNEYTRFNK